MAQKPSYENEEVAADSTEAAYAELAQRMCSLHLSRLSELSRIELYLDQLLTLVSMELSFMCVPGETLVTGSMVNNYVKQGVVPAPHKKRYTRRHVATLLFVCAFKRVFSIAQVAELMGLVYASGADLALLYDEACAALERALAARFSSEGAHESERGIRVVDEKGDPVAPGLARLLDSAVATLAAKVYVEKTLDVAERARGTANRRV